MSLNIHLQFGCTPFIFEKCLKSSTEPQEKKLLAEIKKTAKTGNEVRDFSLFLSIVSFMLE
jgi:hypothetical protein